MSIDAGTIYSSVRIKLEQLESDIRKVQASYEKLGKKIDDSIGNTSKKTASSFKDINLAGVAAFTGIALAAKAAASTFIGFEQAMANVASVARATPEDFEKLTKAAETAGETTRFTATQAADALYFLASAGYNAEKSIAALDGVLQLAGATQSDLAFTSGAVAAAISQFNLEASDASRVANAFTAAITGSQATMEKLATSMQYLGPVASSMGMSIEEALGPLQILYNNGLDASMAGTALRGALSDLANSASPAQKKLRELGVTFNEINPMTNSFSDIIETLNKHSIDGAQALAIFGDRAGPAMIKLMQAGKSEIDKYTKAVTGTNAAAEAYARQNDTLAGSIDFLKSAFESLQIKFVKEISPAIRGVVDIMTKVVAAIANAPAPIKIFVGVLGAGIPVALGLAAAIGAIAAIMGTIAGPILLVVAGVAALTAGIVYLAEQSNRSVALQKDLKVAFEKTQKSIKDYEETQKRYVKAVQEGNTAEAQHLKNLLDAQKLQTTANLKDTIDTIKKLTKEEDNQKKKLSELQKEYDRINNMEGGVKDLNRQLKEQLQWGGKNEIAVKNLQDALKPLNQALYNQQVAIDKQNLSIQNNINSRSDMIDALAEAYNAGQLDLTQLRLADLEMAKLIITRAEQIKKIKEQARAQEELNKTETGTGGAPVKDFWGDFSKSIRKAGEDAALFGNTGDVLKAKLDLVKKKYMELLNDGIDPNSEQMRQLMAIYQSLSTQLDIYNAKLESQKSAEEKLAEAKKKKAEADKEAVSTQQDYQDKLDDLNKTTDDAIFKQWSHALAVVDSSGASAEATDKAKESVNDYYKALMDKKATDEFKKNIATLKALAWDFANSITGALGGLFTAMTTAQIEDLDRLMQAELEAAGLAEKTAVEKAQAEYDAAVASGNAQLAEEKKNALEKAKIEEKYEKKKAELKYKGELATWSMNLLQAIGEGARATISGYATVPFLPVGLAAGTLAASLAGVQIATISASKPKPPKFASGGVTLGSPSTEIPAVLHGNEAVLNSEQMAKAFDMINGHQMGTGGNNKTQVNIIIELDKETLAQSSADVYNSGTIRLIAKKALR